MDYYIDTPAIPDYVDGDSLFFKGDMDHQKLVIRKNDITVDSYDGIARLSGDDHAIKVDGADNVVVRNLDLTSDKYGIVHNNSQGGLYEDLSIHNCVRSGFTTAGNSTIQSGLTLRRVNTHKTGEDDNFTNWYAAMYIVSGTVDFLIEDCRSTAHEARAACFGFSDGKDHSLPSRGEVKNCFASDGWMGFSVSGNHNGRFGNGPTAVDLFNCYAEKMEHATYEQHGSGSTINLYDCGSDDNLLALSGNHLHDDSLNHASIQTRMKLLIT